ncbi:hypothetical protein HanXRQr2_Chr01g0043541 [Helianthus annuus]|uniref:Uncharacterized protein n=1 Tax=Helianthus annuus TaxID=4232 RepID=A0A9K3P4U6_HELAN|nr:hypothetical protein HanXRQr2_Chr01g0043541 [Helianthus annuus]
MEETISNSTLIGQKGSSDGMMDIDTRYSLRHRNKLYCEYNTSGVFSSLGNSESCLLILRWATLSQ